MFCKCQEIRSLWQKLPRVLKDTIRQKLHSDSDVCILTDVSKLKGIPREQCNWISLSLLIVKRVILRHWMVHLWRNLFQTRQKQHLCKEFPWDWEAGWTITEKNFWSSIYDFREHRILAETWDTGKKWAEKKSKALIFFKKCVKQSIAGFWNKGGLFKVMV